MRRLSLLRYRLASERGVSLIETLVTLLIMGIVIGALTTPFVSASKAELDMNRRFQAQEQARIALDQLRRELHCASAVTAANGSALAAGSTYSSIKVTLGSYCSSMTPTGFSTWCTSGGGPWTLYRIASAATTCSAAAGVRPIATYLTTSQPFSLLTQATEELPRLRVSLAVNVNGPTATRGTSSLVDDIALRNWIRQP